MATFTIDLITGKEYLFTGDFTNSGTTIFSGITAANNGLTRVGAGGHTVKLGGTLNCVTTIVSGAGNTAGIEYGGDYSAGFTARSLVDKAYADTKVSTILFNSFTGTTLPANYYNKTQINSYTGQTLTNINSRLLTSIFTGYTATTAPNTYLTKNAFNSFTGTTLPANYYNKTQINSYTASTNLCKVTTIGAATNVESCFGGGLVTAKIRPTANSTTAIQIRKADGTTPVINIDTVSGFTGFGTIAPKGQVHTFGTDNTTSNNGFNIQTNAVVIDGPADVDKDIQWTENGNVCWTAQTYRGEDARYWYLFNVPSEDTPIVISDTGRMGINNQTNIIDYHAALTAGSGPNDIELSGMYTQSYLTVFQVEINGVGNPNTFRWRKSSDLGITYGAYSSTSGLTLSPLELEFGVFVDWLHLTGHSSGSTWTFGVFPQLPLGTFVVSVNAFNEVQSSTDWSAGTVQYVDITAIANSSSVGRDITIFNTGTTLNAIYFGTLVPLDAIYVNLKTAGASMILLTEYWNGATWVNLTTATNAYLDNTLNLTQSGNIQWELTSMSDWVKDNIPDLTGTTNNQYWLRIRTSTNPTIAPIAKSFARGGDKRFSVFTSPLDFSPSMYVDSLGRTNIGGGNISGCNVLQINTSINNQTGSKGSLVEFDSECADAVDLKIKLTTNNACDAGLLFSNGRGTLSNGTNSLCGDYAGRIEFRSFTLGVGRITSMIRSQYTGDGTTMCGDLILSTASNADATEKVRITSSGTTGFGISNPTALIHLCQGTTTIPPLRFTAGPLLSTPQIGAVEFDGGSFRYTITGSTIRKTIAPLESPQFSGNVNLPTTTCLNGSSLCTYILQSGGSLNTEMVCHDIFDSYTASTAIVLNTTITGATNGLCKPNAHSVVLGGDLTQNTVITGNTFNFTLGVKQFNLTTTDCINICDVCGNGIHLYSNGSHVDIRGNDSSGTQKTKFFLSDTDVTFTDCRALTVGIEYDADYSTAFTNRSLVDKGYVDSHGGGLFPKTAVSLATTTGITLSGNQTIDGVLTTTGMRVLVKNQTSGATNGVYSASTGTWGRTSDFDTDAEVVNGSYFFVLTGNTNANTAWILSTPNPITVGVDSLLFTLFSQAGGVTAGNGICVTSLGGNSNVAVKLGANCGLCVAGGGLCVSSDIAGVGLCYGTGTLCLDGTGIAGNSLSWTGTQLAVNTTGGTLSTALNSKLNTTVFNTYTGTTAPATYYTKTQINSYTGTTLTNINSRLLTTTFATYTGTTVPNTYYNKTCINTYTGETATAIGLKANITSPTFLVSACAPTPATNNNTTCIATTAYYIGQAGTASPLMNGTVCVGTSNLFSRQDHIHPIDTSRLAVTTFNTYTGTTSVYGTQYQTASSLLSSGTTSTTGVTKVTLTTTSLPAGNYKITASWVWSRNSGANNAEFDVLIDNVAQGTQTPLVYRLSLSGEIHADSQIFYKALSAGVHTIKFRYYGSTATATTTTSENVIELFRVS